MQLPRAETHYTNACRYARYVGYRLALGGRAAQAKELASAGRALLVAGRAWEDTDEPYQSALATRDAALDALAFTAKTARAALAGRSLSAAREEPYTAIFPDGIGAYVKGPIGEAKRRYGLLRTMLERNLGAKDPTRVSAVTQLREGLERLAAGLDAVQAAEQATRAKRADLDAAQRALLRALEKTYGTLLADLGRQSASGFFPKLTVAPKKPK